MRSSARTTLGDRRVPFLDLKRRVDALRAAVECEVKRVLDRGHFVLGEAGRELEARFARYCDVEHAVAVANGTDALWLTMEALGVGPGDEVVTVSATCAPTAAAIVKTGATPVLVDADEQTCTLDPERLPAALTGRTKCIVPVHLYGQCADMRAIVEVATRYGVPVVEDCAQAHGARWEARPAGSLGIAGCFSFYPTKNLGALGDGGMVVTRDAGLAERLRLLRNYGYAEPNRSVTKGYNSRLDELQAAVLLAGLERLDTWNHRRRAIAARYSAALTTDDIRPPVERSEATHVYHLYVVRARAREALQREFARRGIGTMVHYPVPVHLQPGFGKLCRVAPGGLEHTERLANEVLSLPLYPELRDDEIETVVEALTADAAR
jgi:dTDP-4-amino-4,6-dideoxygalactose transaminase